MKLVVGLHSIMEALKNRERSFKKLCDNEKPGIKLKIVSGQNFDLVVFENLDIFNRETSKILKNHDAKQTRIANGLLLETSFRRVREK